MSIVQLWQDITGGKVDTKLEREERVNQHVRRMAEDPAYAARVAEWRSLLGDMWIGAPPKSDETENADMARRDGKLLVRMPAKTERRP